MCPLAVVLVVGTERLLAPLIVISGDFERFLLLR